MPQDQYTRLDVAAAITQYAEDMQRELAAKWELGEAKGEAEVMEAALIKKGYEKGEIAGKNADACTRSEIIYMAKQERIHELYNALLLTLGQAKTTHDDRVVKRKITEAHLSLIRAWLYSQSGAPH